MSVVVDLSDHQTITDYRAFRDAIGGAYIKVSEGDYFTAGWRTHYNGLAGKPRAPYLFMGQRGNWSGVIARFLEEYRQAAWEWGPVFDIEPNTARYPSLTPSAGDIRALVGEWRRQSGLRFCYVYAGKFDLTHQLNPSLWIDGDMDIIAARYLANDYNGAFANLGWDHPQLTMTQYWNAGALPGLAPRNVVDLNNFRGGALRSAWAQPYQPPQEAFVRDYLIDSPTLIGPVNVNIEFALSGERELRIINSFGETVYLHQAVFFGDTLPVDVDYAPGGIDPRDPNAPADPANLDTVAVKFDPGRPGPISIPTLTAKGRPVVGGSMRVTAAKPFTLNLR